MAGLLDFLQTPAGQGLLATGLGAAASYGHGRGLLGNVGAGGLMGLQAYTGANENEQKKVYMKAQMDNIASEVETRKAALAKQQQIMALLTGDGAPTLASHPQGQLGSGSFGAVAPDPGVPDIAPQTATMGGSGGASRVGSLTPDRLAALKANGLDLVDVFKLTQPDMQVSNGYAYDKRNVKPGFLPQANVSQNGQATVMTPGPDGMPRVSMPPGALDSYTAYRQADEAAKAGQDLVKVVGPDGAERYVTRAQAIQATQPAPRPAARPALAPQGSPQGAYVGDPQVVQAAINDIKDPNERTRAQQAYEQQYGPLQASPTTAQKTGLAFGEKMAANQAEALDKSRTSARTAADDLLGIQQARQSLQAGVFAGSGAESKLAIAKFINANIPGITVAPEKVTNTDYLKSTLGRGLLEQAKTLGSNPSNADANRINDIVGSIGKDPQAMAKILDWRQEMSMRAIKLHNTSVDQAEASGYKAPFDLRVTNPLEGQKPSPAKRSVTRTGMYGGKKVIQYSDGTVEYAN